VFTCSAVDVFGRKRRATDLAGGSDRKPGLVLHRYLRRAVGFTGLARAQLALAEQVYSALGDLLRASDRDPTGVGALEEELAQLVGRHLEAADEWPPEILAAEEPGPS